MLKNAHYAGIMLNAPTIYHFAQNYAGIMYLTLVWNRAGESCTAPHEIFL